MGETCITVRRLCKTYETYKRGSTFKETLKSFFKREKVKVDAVKSVSFDVPSGGIIGILGPNGAGKSTTIKMLTGTLFPTSGEIDVLGFTPSKDRAAYVGHIGAVFGQKSQLIWDIPPADSFMMNKAIYAIPEKDYKARLGAMSEILGLGDTVDKPTRVLSLGERMKCEFVMAMLHGPKVVFLDEPTIGLDVIAKQRIREFILAMNGRGTTFVLTTHDLEDVERLARTVIIINHGEKVFDGDLSGLKKTLGAKKIIRLTLARPAPGLAIPNTVVISRESELELTLEADVSASPVSALLKNISERCEFTDIAIKELPMETVITAIYQDGRGLRP
jgi:ABC-2 type transport system ATP-binding protein